MLPIGYSAFKTYIGSKWGDRKKFHASENQKITRLDYIYVRQKDFKSKTVMRDKEGQYVMSK